MAKDKANIFNLEVDLFEEYAQDPFCDCFESMKTFGEALKNDILTKQTPHTLLLDADYGMGKTFFSTRFAQYLIKEKIDTVYFSAWENDYMSEPFISFSKEIVSYIHKKYKTKKWLSKVANLFEKIEKVISSTSIRFCRVQVSSADLIKAFKQETDSIKEFKKELTDFIDKLEKKKLVIIVDELDRCRPDYAMKTLECIKHFFDIEGLFVIIPTNKQALHDSTTALFGITQETEHKECYFQKFFNDERKLKKPTEDDYQFILKEYINQTELRIAIDSSLLSTDGKYNSLDVLINSMAKYSKSAGLTFRMTKDLTKELVRMCCHFNEPVRCEWLACLVAYRHKNKNYPFRYPLSSEHCFYEDNRGNDNHVKKQLQKFVYLKNIFRAHPDFNNYKAEPSRVQYNQILRQINQIVQGNYLNYDEMYEKLDFLTIKIQEMKSLTYQYGEVLGHINKLDEGVMEQMRLIQEYQDKYGSDDNDDDRCEKYKQIVESPELLYTQ